MRSDSQAFPRAITFTEHLGRAIDGKPGMTLAEYFAARAPETIPDWYVGPTIKWPVMPAAEDFFKNDEQIKLARDWKRDPCYDLESAFSAAGHVTPAAPFVEAMEKYWHETATAKQQAEETRYFAWRVFYGKQMAEAFE